MTEPLPTMSAPRRTPLHGLHLRLGARMVPFAGYEMPLQYPAGIIKEHLHTRAAASLFDVSHMGQVAVRPRSGAIADAARALETLVPGDIAGLPAGRQRYTMLTATAGGILDDLVVSSHGDDLMLVVNAARKDFDEAHLRAALSDSCVVEPQADRALVALQGPAAENALAAFTPEVRAMRFMDVRTASILGTPCFVSRSGYTGEDGFEISLPAAAAEPLCEALLQNEAVAPAGLGARDSLRLEAGLCLYGADLDETTTPVEAALEWTIPKVRRAGGARAGGFPGADVILEQLKSSLAAPVSAPGGGKRAPHRRVGLRPEGRAPVRAGAPLFRNEDEAAPVGAVSSGGFGVSLDAPIAMGYVPPDATAPGTRVFAEVRGRRLAMTVATLPFVPARYKR
jgi:aminomethyltransferase